jgi:4-hydroxybenzoyl-CoA thioesterase
MYLVSFVSFVKTFVRLRVKRVFSFSIGKFGLMPESLPGKFSMKFTARRMIQFHHCDPAGIVFYPQFFYILSEVKEEFLIHIGQPMHKMINEQRIGWPMVRLETDFKKPSRYGDQVEIDIQLFKLGGTSIGLQYSLRGPEGERMLAKTIIVLTHLDTGKPVPMSDTIRSALQPYLIKQ